MFGVERINVLLGEKRDDCNRATPGKSEDFFETASFSFWRV
jgi:hypothetical protein